MKPLQTSLKKSTKMCGDSSGDNLRLWTSGSAPGGSGGALGGPGRAFGGSGRALGDSIYRQTPDQPQRGHHVFASSSAFLSATVPALLSHPVGRMGGTFSSGCHVQNMSLQVG